MIVVDDKDEELDFTPVSNIGGDEIRMPIMVVRKTPGEAMIKQLSSKDPKIRAGLVLSFMSPIRKETTVDLHIVASAFDSGVYKFMSQFNSMADSLG